MANHYILGGTVQLYQRKGTAKWWARATVDGAQFQKTTGEESLAKASDVAKDWYLTLTGKAAMGTLHKVPTFVDAAEKWIEEFEVMTRGQRSEIYIYCHKLRIAKHLKPFFGDKPITDITSGMVQEYRVKRIKAGGPKGKPLGHSTLHQEIVVIRQALKYANRVGWLSALPDLSNPYRGATKVGHRAWFTPDEYRRLYTATGERAKNPKKERWRTASEDLHDYVLFMANTGLRPDEARRIQVNDVTVVKDGRSNILHIAVRGKRGTGYAKSLPGAVMPYTRMKKRHGLGPQDLLFPRIQKELLNTILDELNLKKDREGSPRSAYSLRHTYITMRLMEGADVYQIAKNCRTSVEMIEKHYARHIKNRLDASAINTRRHKIKSDQGLEQ